MDVPDEMKQGFHQVVEDFLNDLVRIGEIDMEVLKSEAKELYEYKWFKPKTWFAEAAETKK